MPGGSSRDVTLPPARPRSSSASAPPAGAESASRPHPHPHTHTHTEMEDMHRLMAAMDETLCEKAKTIRQLRQENDMYRTGMIDKSLRLRSREQCSRERDRGVRDHCLVIVRGAVCHLVAGRNFVRWEDPDISTTHTRSLYLRRHAEPPDLHV